MKLYLINMDFVVGKNIAKHEINMDFVVEQILQNMRSKHEKYNKNGVLVWNDQKW